MEDDYGPKTVRDAARTLFGGIVAGLVAGRLLEGIGDLGLALLVIVSYVAIISMFFLFDLIIPLSYLPSKSWGRLKRHLGMADEPSPGLDAFGESRKPPSTDPLCADFE